MVETSWHLAVLYGLLIAEALLSIMSLAWLKTVIHVLKFWGVCFTSEPSIFSIMTLWFGEMLFVLFLAGVMDLVLSVLASSVIFSISQEY